MCYLIISLKCGINRLGHFAVLHFCDHFSRKAWGKEWVMLPLYPVEEFWEQFMLRDLCCTLRQAVCSYCPSKIKEKLECNHLKMILRPSMWFTQQSIFASFFFI